MLLCGAVVLVAAAAVLLLMQEPSEAERGADGASPAVVAAPDDEARGMDAPTPAGRDADPVERLDVPAATAAPDDPAAATPDDADTTARLVGRVTYRADGAPATGVELVLRTPGTLTSAPPHAVTDDDGRYAFVLADPVIAWAVEVRPGPRMPGQLVRESLALLEGTETVFDFEVHTGCAVAGVVVDATGRPVPGATVLGWSARDYPMTDGRLEPAHQETETDGAGAFRLDWLGEDFVVCALAEGLAPDRALAGHVDADALVDGVELVVSPERRIVGTVRTTVGASVQGATIVLRSEIPTSQRVTRHEGVFGFAPPRRHATSGADGRFLAQGLCRRTYRVTAAADGHREWSGTHAVDDGELLIELAAGLSLTGTVLGPGGATVAGARVKLGSASDMSANIGFVQTDDEGRFLFEDAAPDTDAYLAAVADGLAVHVEQPVVIEEGGLNHVDLRLRPERRLAGLVVDVDGAPVEGAGISVEGDRIVDLGATTMFPVPTWESQFGHVTMRTLADGAFSIGNLYDGVFRLTAKAQDGGATAVVDVRSGAEDLRIVLDPDAVVGVTLTGVARDGVTGLPVTTFGVTPMLAGPGGGFAGSNRDFDDEEGRWRITGLDEGAILLNASCDGYAPWSGGVRTFEDGEHRIDIAFLPTRRVTFRVVDPKREPVDATLTFRDADGQQLMVESGPGSRMSVLSTGEDGVAIAGGLPAARLTVTVKRGWLGPEREYAVDLRDAPSGPIELVYGEDALRTLLVLVTAGAPGEPPPADAPVFELARWLQAEVEAGNLRAAPGRVDLVARDEDGAIVAQTNLGPGDADAVPFVVPGVGGPIVASLEVPARPVTLEATAEGFVSEPVAWSPDGGEEFAVVVLRAE